MKVSLYIILISILLSKHYVLSHIIRKRQLFREQVLPHAGGKIPDSAFLTDRLALNRLQKDGIAVPDGVLLEQRPYQVFPHQHRTVRPTFRVVQTPDNRYISPEGEYGHNTLATVDTTYLIPHSGDKLLLHDYHHYPPSQPQQQPHLHPHRFGSLSYAVPKAPNLKELRIPNYAVFNFDYKKKKPYGVPLPQLATLNHHHPATIKLDGPRPHQRLPQDFVSYHAAVGNGLNYPPALARGRFPAGGRHEGKEVPGGWSSGWTPSTGGALSGESFAAQPLGGSLEDYYSPLEERHRFYRDVPGAKPTPIVAKGPKPDAVSPVRTRERGHPQRHQA